MIWSGFYLGKEEAMSRSLSVFMEMSPETMTLDQIFLNS